MVTCNYLIKKDSLALRTMIWCKYF